MNIFQSNAPIHRTSVHILAIIGFIALVSGGIWGAVYATRFVPEIVNSTGEAAMYLGSAFAPVATLGLILSPSDTTLYWVVFFGLSLFLVYLFFFVAVPTTNRYAHTFGSRVSTLLNAPRVAPVAIKDMPSASKQELPKTSREYSSYDGFKSFTPNSGALSVEDIVKGLSQKHSVVPSEHMEEFEELTENVEPIYENVEPIVLDSIVPVAEVSSPARNFTIALVAGDRTAVFSALRQQTRNGDTPEQLMSAIVCLLDEVYRARIDGTACDADISRMTARLSTPTLEKLIDSLTTAIDSSYSSRVTGAKLALIRALAVLGA